MNILGISAFYHDSAACLVRDGRIVAAAQEERFSRRKHDARFPIRAVNFCLDKGSVPKSGIDVVAYYEKPLTKFVRILKSHMASAPLNWEAFRQAIPLWLKERLWLPYTIELELRRLGYSPPHKFVYPEHHQAHQASAFFPRPLTPRLSSPRMGSANSIPRRSGREREIEFRLYGSSNFLTRSGCSILPLPITPGLKSIRASTN